MLGIIGINQWCRSGLIDSDRLALVIKGGCSRSTFRCVKRNLSARWLIGEGPRCTIHNYRSLMCLRLELFVQRSALARFCDGPSTTCRRFRFNGWYPRCCSPLRICLQGKSVDGAVRGFQHSLIPINLDGPDCTGRVCVGADDMVTLTLCAMCPAPTAGCRHRKRRAIRVILVF